MHGLGVKPELGWSLIQRLPLSGVFLSRILCTHFLVTMVALNTEGRNMNNISNSVLGDLILVTADIFKVLMCQLLYNYLSVYLMSFNLHYNDHLRYASILG